ncbi:MAG: hypothetical protein E7A56_10465, partial [Cutibacterium avidum]|nr:hypothetical protein [Cutibacterium avidum]
KKHNAALICLSRRRCDVLFAMLKNREPYRAPPPPLPSRLDAELGKSDYPTPAMGEKPQPD